MKIALLTATFSAFSGIDRLVEIQAKKFFGEGHEVHVFCLAGGLKVSGVSVHTLGMPRSGFLQRMYRLLFFLDVVKVGRYSKILSSFDRVISHIYPMNVLAAAAKKRNPKLMYQYHNAGVGIVETYSYFEKQYLKLLAAFNNHYAKKCDTAVSISQFLADVLKKETGVVSSVEHIPIDASRFHPKVSGAAVRKKYGLTKPVLLYVGRISPHKGVHLLLKAFAEIQKKVDCHLLIVGKGTFSSYMRRLKKMAGKNVTFAGFVPDALLGAYYGACDVYVTGTLWEGFDMPLAEANACGKDAVAFEVGAHKEVLKNGKLVAKGDVDAFAKAVVEILNGKK